MGRQLLRILASVGLLALAGFAACQLLLPERFAVNAPMANAIFGWGIEPPADEVLGTRLRVPDGYHLSIYAALPRVRFLRATARGDLLATVPREGRVVLMERDANGDGLPDAVRTLLEDLDRPHGLDLYQGWLYVALGTAVVRVRYDVERGELAGELEEVVTGLAEGGNHWTRSVRFGPDGWMYVTVGSSCNVCFEEQERRAAMLRFRPDGSEGELYASGLRNSVGFDWRPGSQELYATENGRDLLGDNFPPCELNQVVRGGDYGWPVANGQRVLDPDLGPGNEDRAAASLPPAFEFAAHNAPLGIQFLRAPGPHAGTALVALHGSWNRTRKDGYRVVALRWRDGEISSEDFLWGFLEDDDVIGRPVDVTEAADGTLFVSDDYAGVVYRIARSPTRATAPPAQRAKPAPAQSPPDGEAERAARGEILYEAHACAGCHEAERAAPGVVAVPLDGLAGRADLGELTALLETPPPPMPAFPLTGEQRRELASFLLTHFPELPDS